jgi:hypothetical protein
MIQTGTYQHFKGNLYVVEAIATDSKDAMTQVVVYKSVADGRVWVRELRDFEASVRWPDGSFQPRFMPVALAASV